MDGHRDGSVAVVARRHAGSPEAWRRAAREGADGGMARRAGEARKAGGRIERDDGFAGLVGALPLSLLEDEARLPDALSLALQDLDACAVSNVQLCRAIAAKADGIADARPIANALIEIGEAADRSGLSNAYHNPAHSRDVGAVFLNLARLEFLDERDRNAALRTIVLGCCAAFGHDIGHDGGDSSGAPFRLERVAAGIVGDILRRNGVPLRLAEMAECAVLTTDVHEGYEILDAALRGAPIQLGPEAPAALRLIADPVTRHLAFLLRDADVMQSAGLSPDDHDRQTRRLEAEQGIPRNTLGARGADFFLRDMIRGHFLSEAGHLFQPRLGRLLYLNDLRAAAGRTGGEGLAEVARREATLGC
jgi:hypothetical protein